MGTSQSSGGPLSGVPMVPPWVPDPTDNDTLDDPRDVPNSPPVDSERPQVPGTEPKPTAPISPIAPPRRFGSVRISLGNFARTGDAVDLRRSVGHYVRTGYGGSGTAVRRLGGTASTAGALYNALSGQLTAPDSPLDLTLLTGRSAEDVINAVIEAVRPIDGTQDAEAGRAAIRNALSELLTLYPNADLLNLNDEQRAFAIERYVASDVYRRFDLDVGKTIREKAPSASTALSRLKQVRDYIKQTVAASFRKLRNAGRTIRVGRVGSLVRDALRETFEVFEGYLE